MHKEMLSRDSGDFFSCTLFTLSAELGSFSKQKNCAQAQVGTF
jgi:hypothetical protein